MNYTIKKLHIAYHSNSVDKLKEGGVCPVYEFPRIFEDDNAFDSIPNLEHLLEFDKICFWINTGLYEYLTLCCVINFLATHSKKIPTISITNFSDVVEISSDQSLHTIDIEELHNHKKEELDQMILQRLAILWNLIKAKDINTIENFTTSINNDTLPYFNQLILSYVKSLSDSSGSKSVVA